jgi:hypothetical protein
MNVLALICRILDIFSSLLSREWVNFNARDLSAISLFYSYTLLPDKDEENDESKLENMVFVNYIFYKIKMLFQKAQLIDNSHKKN